MDLWKVTTEWQQMLSLMDNYDNLSGEELQEYNMLCDKAQQDLTAFLAQGLDAKDMLSGQYNYCVAKIDELNQIKKRISKRIDKVDGLLKSAVVMTNQKTVAIDCHTLSVRNNPGKLVIDDDSGIADGYKQISITLPLSLAKSIAFEHDLDIDWSKAETLKSEIKKLMTDKEQPIEFPGCRIVKETSLVIK